MILTSLNKRLYIFLFFFLASNLYSEETVDIWKKEKTQSDISQSELIKQKIPKNNNLVIKNNSNNSKIEILEKINTTEKKKKFMGFSIQQLIILA